MWFGYDQNHQSNYSKAKVSILCIVSNWDERKKIKIPSNNCLTGDKVKWIGVSDNGVDMLKLYVNKQL